MTDAESAVPAGPAGDPSETGGDDVMDPSFAVVAARAADAKGAEDVVVLRVGDVLAITDYFVIASASNSRLVRAVAQDVEEQVARSGGPRPARIEGMESGEWVLLDFGAFVVHVFYADTRKYYELERLWGDVPAIDWGAAERHTAAATTSSAAAG